jgi:hypothetical protein
MPHLSQTADVPGDEQLDFWRLHPGTRRASGRGRTMAGAVSTNRVC